LEYGLVVGEAGDNGGVSRSSLVEDLGDEGFAEVVGADGAPEDAEACGDFVWAVGAVVVAAAREGGNGALEGGARLAFVTIPGVQEVGGGASRGSTSEDASLLGVEDGTKGFAILLELEEEEFDVLGREEAINIVDVSEDDRGAALSVVVGEALGKSPACS
jgi:hypothetical protein